MKKRAQMIVKVPRDKVEKVRKMMKAATHEQAVDEIMDRILLAAKIERVRKLYRSERPEQALEQIFDDM